jgi:hypothetical protein
VTIPNTIAGRLSDLYRGLAPSTVLALPAGTYTVRFHDDDGETALVNGQGEVWDPNSVYPFAGEWTRDGEPVLYDDLRPGDVATLVTAIYRTQSDADQFG